MTDIVDQKTRSRMMSGIRGKNTRPEMVIRRALHRLGFRYRLHVSDIPGKPDLVFPRLRAVIFINGCFWHAHNCHLFKWPSSRKKFWRSKIEGNRQRDEIITERLHNDGWRVLTVWECAIKGRTRRDETELVQAAAEWLAEGTGDFELSGGSDANFR